VLVPALTRPGVDLATLAIEVREEVARVALTAGHAQQPAYYDQTIGGRVYLNGGPSGAGQQISPAVSDAERTWRLVQNTASLAALDDFIRQFGDVPVYGALARERREQLAKPQAKEPIKEQPQEQVTEPARTGGKATTPEEPFEKLLAGASVERGQAATKACAVCHNFQKGGPNTVGPNLYAIVGRARASALAFNYTDAMKAKGGEWTLGDLDKFLTNPKEFVPGTSMVFRGLANGNQRADLIAYLNSLADNPKPLSGAHGDAGGLCNGALCMTPLTAAQERALKPKDSFRECKNCPEMVVVPAGAFTIGSPANEKDRERNEGPQHTVTIGKPLAVGKFHVTVDQFSVLIRETGYVASANCFKWPGWVPSGSWRNPGFVQEGSHPVVCISQDDAKAYVDWLVNKTGKSYRLLSEAEWEYAARGRTSPGDYPRFWFGDNEKEICRYAKSNASSCKDRYEYTSPAGSYAPNLFGLYDMAGNAWQLTADCFHDSYDGAPADGSAWTTMCSSDDRVVRGNAWHRDPGSLRAAERHGVSTEGNVGGFRVARTLAP
jgi:formylglycine-generating enzyme required for sulfatase activity